MAEARVKNVIEKAVASGNYGSDVIFIDALFSDAQGEDHFASAVIFAQVSLKENDELKHVNIVIKRQQDNAFIRDMMNTDPQFYNEVVMYEDILPFINKNNIINNTFPRFLHGKATLGDNPEDDIVVIEDLKYSGFRLTDEKLFLDFDHCVLALRKLGEFHALSYAAKQENLDGFFEKVGKLKEVRWDQEQREELNRYLTTSMERGIIPLVEKGEHYDILEKFLEKIDDPCKFMQNLVRPEEPIAVLCHGDFCRNNIVYKYDGGKPVDVRFFDVATARYSSPIIDISFFLFMNTTTELRRQHWDDLLKVYHNALASAVPGNRVPSLEIIRMEMSRRASYAYVLCSFFVPTMLCGGKTDVDEFASMSPEEIDELNRTKGGPEGTKLIMDILKDLMRWNCL